MAQKLTTAQFIERARAVHGPVYDYSKVEYGNAHGKVLIICPEHGEFEQAASRHLSGSGCKPCAMAPLHSAQRHSTEGFIVRATALHGSLYDYSLVKYSNAVTKIAIRCRTHGVFMQTPSKHLEGQGCPSCKNSKISASQLQTLAQFIEKANNRHGIRYSYDRVCYKGAHSKIVITCPDHGDFKQSASSHLGGNGCPKCAHAVISKLRSHSLEQFLIAARAKHGNKYDYSRVVYNGAFRKVEIICPEHGPFFQRPTPHASSGYGCSRCANVKRREAARLHWTKRANGRLARLYLLRIYSKDEVFYKVGITYYSVEHRFLKGTALKGYNYEVLGLHTSPNAAAVFDWEQSILETFAYLHYTPRHSFDGATECFSSADEILAIFPVAG